VILLVLLMGVGVAVFLRLLAGYPATSTSFAVLAPREAAFLDAAGETFFPPDDTLPVSGGHADLPGYADRYLVALPGRQRTLVRALFALFEHFTLVSPARGRGGFRRFSSLSPEQRFEVLRGWESSGLYVRRMAFTALKAVLILGYVGHPQSLNALGLSPWKIESPRVEADFLYPPIGEGRDRVPVRPPGEPSPARRPPLVPGFDQESP
jgi:hypothetical protein